MLGAIYDNIVATPITLKDDDEARRAAATASVPSTDERARRLLQSQERAELVAAGQEALSAMVGGGGGAASAAGGGRRAGGAQTYYSFADVNVADHALPLWETAWAPVFACFSVVLETAADEDRDIINPCLRGLAQAIHVSGLLGTAVPRDACVSSLCKFSTLEPGSGVREMRGKNIACVRALMNVAFNEGDRLGTAWGPILVCVSALARLLNKAAGGMEDSAYFATAAPRKSAGGARQGGAAAAASPQQQKNVSAAAVAAQRAAAEKARAAAERDAAIEAANARLLAATVEEASVTRLFTRSIGLSDEAVVHFVTQLAAVSLAELQVSARSVR